MAFYFTPPTETNVPPVYKVRDPFRPASRVAHSLFRHYSSRSGGVSVLKQINGTYVTKTYPTQHECDAAAAVYIGGHRYSVTAAEKTSLEANGFTVETI